MKHLETESERRHTQNRFNRDTVFIMKENVFILRFTESNRTEQNRAEHVSYSTYNNRRRLSFAFCTVCVQWLHKRDIYTHYPFIRSGRCANSIFNAVYLSRILFSRFFLFPYAKLWLFKICIISMIARIPHAPINWLSSGWASVFYALSPRSYQSHCHKFDTFGHVHTVFDRLIGVLFCSISLFVSNTFDIVDQALVLPQNAYDWQCKSNRRFQVEI